MPWFPDFVAAAELARRETRAAGQADPIAEYLRALSTADPRELETVWPGEVVVYDPRAGEVRGHRHLRHYFRVNHELWAGRHVRVESKASTSSRGRGVVELVVHLDADADEVLWPIAVVAESHDDRSAEFRTYCSQWPVDGRHHLRPPILEPGAVHPGDVVGRFQSALAAGDADALVELFAADGYLREPIGPHAVHSGAAALHSFFSGWLGAGGIDVQDCVVTDDGVRCAVEYNLVRWGSHDLPAQAGIAVFERGSDGLLAAARIYDDVDAPVDRS